MTAPLSTRTTRSMANGDAGLIDVPSLRALLVFALPDGLVVKSWSADPDADRADASAARLGALLLDARRALAALAGADDGLLLTLESQVGTVLATAVEPDLAVGLLFEPDAPLGLVRVQAREIAEKVRATARGRTAKAAGTSRPRRPRALRLLELRLHQSPDHERELHRWAQIAGVSVEALRQPEGLSPAALARLESALDGSAG